MKFKQGQLVKFCDKIKSDHLIHGMSPGGWLKRNEDDKAPLWDWVYLPADGVFLYLEEYVVDPSIKNTPYISVPVVLVEEGRVYMKPGDIEAYEP